jgi:hypothetical protein
MAGPELFVITEFDCIYLAKVHPVGLLPQLGNGVPLLHLTNTTTSTTFTWAFDRGRKGLRGLARWWLLKLFHFLLDLKTLLIVITKTTFKSLLILQPHKRIHVLPRSSQPMGLQNISLN